MGFRSATYNIKKLSEQLDISQDKLYSAMKASRIGGFARLWKVVEVKENFANCNISVSSRKDAESPYEVQFQDGFVCFAGPAFEKVKQLDIPEKGVPIVILSCDVRTNFDDKTNKKYTNYAVFEFDVLDGSSSNSNAGSTRPKTTSAKRAPEVKGDVYDDDDELPF